jgi:hypothetical protein
MKKENQKIMRSKWSLVAAVFVLGNSAASLANDGSLKSVESLKNENLSETALVRTATLRIEDAKALLGLGGRKPNVESSSVKISSVDEGSQIHAGFVMSMDAGSRSALEQKISSIESERATLLGKLKKEESQEGMKLKQERRNLQMKRLNAGPAVNSQEVARSLFNSLIEESSIQTRTESELALFDDMNTLNVEYVVQNGTQIVASISLGGENLWSSTNNASQVAMSANR